MEEVYDEAIILLGHGSRIPGAGEGMELVAERLKEKLEHNNVEICYMTHLGPHFPEVLEKCVANGARKIIIIPYLLHGGMHLIQDIPRMIQAKARDYQGVKLILGKNLGFDDCLVDLVKKRIEEAMEFGDVREMGEKVNDGSLGNSSNTYTWPSHRP